MLCYSEEHLLSLLNKVNEAHYTNGIVNLSKFPLTDPERSVLSKGLIIAPIQGLQAFVMLSKTWMFLRES